MSLNIPAATENLAETIQETKCHYLKLFLFLPYMEGGISKTVFPWKIFTSGLSTCSQGKSLGLLANIRFV